MKKALSVILSLAIAVCAFSSCAQKKDVPVEEVSVNSVSIPDELKTETDESDLNETSNSQEENDINSVSDSKSENNSESESESESNSESESESVSESESQSESESASESDNDSSSTSDSGASSAPGNSENSDSQYQPVQTTIPKNDSTQSGVKTTTTKVTPSASKVTTTKAQANISTSKATTTKVTSTTTAITTSTHATAVTLKPSEISYPEGASIINLSGSPSCDDSNVSISSGKISINAGGVYYLSGNYSGQIYIKTGEGNAGESDVDLYLAGVDISSSYGPAIFCDNAKRLEIHIVEGTSNVIEDNGSDPDNNGAIFSNDTVEIRGKGTLTIYGNNREGIASDDDIFIENGNIYIFSADDGLNANDCITINGGYTYIEANGDGLDSKGTTVMTDGTVIIAKTGALESSIESDSTYTLNGGTLIAIGGSGLVKGATATSTQAIITLQMDTALAARTLINVKNGSTSLVTFSPVSSYCAFTFTCPELTKGSQYDIYASGTASGGAFKDNVYTDSVISGAVKIATVSAS